mmetsp:Transcript_21583/g.67370  ORF Transcript_21583/g.67370 Transcript_21583/m.67370 type:complete len:291 (-) Transcript_21583:173-1045(-)
MGIARASLAAAGAAPASTRACAVARSTPLAEGPGWPWSSRTRCQVSRPSAADLPSSFRNSPGSTALALACELRRTACSPTTAATSAKDSGFGRKSARCFCRAVRAVAASSVGGSERAAKLATSFRPKEAEMASTRWRCTAFWETCRPNSTTKSAARSPSRSELQCSTQRTRFASARRPRGPRPASSRAAASSPKGKRPASQAGRARAAAAGSKAGEPRSFGMPASPNTAHVSRAAASRSSKRSPASSSSASASASSGWGSSGSPAAGGRSSARAADGAATACLPASRAQS